MTQSLCNSSNTLFLMNLMKKSVWLRCFSEMSVFQPSVRFSVNDMFNTQLFGNMFNLPYFNVSLWLSAHTAGREVCVAEKPCF